MDVNQAPYQMVQQSTPESEAEPLNVVVPTVKPTKYDISSVMAEMGRKGGKIGGKRRLETMTKAERKKIARKAARARWKRATDSSI